MCLYKCHRFPKRAKEPIEVYKFLVVSDSKYYPPYYPDCGGFSIGDIIKSEISPIFGILSEEIGPEGVHSFYSEWLWFYREEYIRIVGDRTETRALVRCEIPKGTLYYEGCSGEVASGKLKLCEVLMEYPKDYVPSPKVKEKHGGKYCKKKK